MTKKEAIEYVKKFFEQEPVVQHDYFYERLLDYLTSQEEQDGPVLMPVCNKKGKYDWE